MIRVLVTSTPGMANRGGEALVRGAIHCITAAMPDSRITFLCHHFDGDKDTFARISSEDSRITMIKHPWYRESGSMSMTAVQSGANFLLSFAECALLRVATRLGLKPNNPFHNCDLVLDLNVDVLNEYYQGVFPPFFALANILLGVMAGKPVVVCAASMAPFERRRYMNSLARLMLNRVGLITVREEFSLGHLRDMGVDKPRASLTADMSFLLGPCPDERAGEIVSREGLDGFKRPLIGVAVAHRSLFAHPERYVRLMAAASDALVKEMDASLIFIPNAFSAGIGDESTTIQEIRDRTAERERTGLIKGPYTAAEIKGIISQCDVLVSAKFHPLLFAASVGVPGVGIVGYHKYKFHGVLGRMLGQEDLLINIDEYSDNESLVTALLSKVRLAWQNREAIRRDLVDRVEAARSLAYLNGGLIKELLQQA